MSKSIWRCQAIVNSLEQELRDLVILFNRERVEYALCGGMAVALHGYPRFTKDIDFLIPKESLEKARKAAEMLGFLDESGRIPFPDSDVYRILKIEGADIRIGPTGPKIARHNCLETAPMV